MNDKLLKVLVEELTVEELQQLVSECNGWDGSLKEYYYYNNDEEFFNIFFESNPVEVARSICYGDYDYNHDYVQFNAYENLESYSVYDVETELEENAEKIIEKALELHEENSIDIDYIIESYVDELEDDEEE